MKTPVRISAASGIKLTLSAIALCSLAACGGGGGGGSNDAGNPPAQVPAASDQLTLTSSNYATGVQEVLSADAKLQSGGGSVTSVLGVDATAATTPMQHVRAVLPQLDGWLRAAAGTAVGITRTATQSCGISGTLNATVNDNNNSGQLDTGDSAVLEFKNCNDGAGTTSGTLTMAVNSLTGSLTSTVFTADFTGTFGNLTTVATAETLTMDGPTRIVLDSALTGTKSRLTSDSFKMSGTLAGTNYSRLFTKFDSMHTRTATSGGYSDTISITGSLNSTNLNSQTVQVTTVAPLVSTSAGLVSGELQVTGAANSKARLTADGANKALIELDANGDGTFEAKTTAAWPLVRP